MRTRLTGTAAIDGLVIALATAFYAAFIARSGFTLAGKSYYPLIDDSMISMTYARSLADGHGLVWQEGSRVEGYTNFLWTIWMAIVHLLPFSDRIAGLPVMISGAAILVATMLVARRICGILAPDRPLVATAAMLLVGLCYPLAFWTLRGMEAGLCALLLALAVLLALRLREAATGRGLAALGAVLAAAVLTRDDMLVPALVIVSFAAAWQRDRWRRSAAIVGGIVVSAIAAHAAFRLAYYGDALPNTYYLKLEGVPLGTRLHRGLVGVTWTAVTGLHMPIALAAIALLCARRTRRVAGLALLAAVVLSEFAYSVYVGGDFAEQGLIPNRFIAPVLPLMMVLAAVGVSDLVRRAGDPRARRFGIGLGIVLVTAAAALQHQGWDATRLLYYHGGPAPDRWVRVVLAVAAVVVLAYIAIDSPGRRRWPSATLSVVLVGLALATLNYSPGRGWVADGPDPQRFGRLETGRATIFREFSSPSSSVALIAAGNWGYFSHRRGVDLLGKVDPVIANGPNRPITFKPGHTKWDYDYSIGRLRPDAVSDLIFATTSDVCKLGAWGYRQIAPHFFVRLGARGIDLPRLSARLRAFDRGRPWIPVPARCRPRP